MTYLEFTLIPVSILFDSFHQILSEDMRLFFSVCPVPMYESDRWMDLHAAMG